MPKLLSLLVAIFFASSFLTVRAQNTVVQSEQEMNCEEILTKIDDKVKFFRSKEPKHIETYQILWLKVATIAGRADTLGYDTDILYENLEELDELIEDFTDKFELFVTNLSETKNYACLQNQNSYVASIAKTKRSLNDVRQSTTKINDFYEKEIRENILNMERIETNGQ